MVLGGRWMQHVSRDSQDRIADANALATETLGAVGAVPAHAREVYERGRFDSAVQIAVRTATKRISVQAVMTATVIMLFFGAITLVLWSGAHNVDRESHDRRHPDPVRTVRAVRGRIGYGIGRGLERIAARGRRDGAHRRARTGKPGIVAPANPKPLPKPLRGEVR